MIRVCITAVQNSPQLLECSPRSIVGCVIQASELQLEMSGPLGQCYMVPYFNKHSGQKEAQFQVGYRGFLSLAWRTGRIQTFASHCVYEGDRFHFQYGTDPKLIHVPAMKPDANIEHVYSILLTRGGGKDFEIMSLEQVKRHRERYSKQKSSNSAWETAFDEMARKTLIRKIAKRAPISVQLQKAAVLDEYGEAGIPQGMGLELGALQAADNLPPDNGRHRLGQTEPTIDERQEEELARAIAAGQVDGTELCLSFGVPVLKKLPQYQFEDAMRWVAERTKEAKTDG